MKEHLFDLIIIGGGIHGAAAARRLSVQGYDVALVEKDDFCQATSANSLKILHGGLRYLQHADFRRMRESICCRREFMQLAPHLVQPLACLMPTRGIGLHGKMVMGTAFLLNDLISFDRNKGLAVENSLGRGRILSRREGQRLIPGLDDRNITGAALWYDALLLNTERMVLLLLHQAAANGAVLVNYVQAEGLSWGAEEQEVHVRDRIGGERFVVRTRKVINCAGPWMNEVSAETDWVDNTTTLAKAVNIIVDRTFFGEYAVGIEGTSEYNDKDAVLKRGKRLFFFVPWRGKTMIGTTYRHCPLSDAGLVAGRDDIGQMVQEINRIYPAAKLGKQDVIFSHEGLVPAYAPGEEAGADPVLLKHSEIIDHQQQGGPAGLISVLGVKYTTAPRLARDLEALLHKKDFLPTVRQKRETDRQSVPDQSVHRDLAEKFPHVCSQYGEQAGAVYQIMASEPDSQALVSAEPPLSRAEILFALRHEMACHLSDMVMRRSEIGSCGRPLQSVLEAVSDVMALELNWSDEQRSRELKMVEDMYVGMKIVPS